ncbi:SpoIIE family protein phosphatase [Rubinisphaera margarita]|uniref:SpoIIE family protein phosphatase n=1 Tax=Rubinisphaera margarita TaxID=2909586 RepID=UPI001EE8B2B1|nr:SpoIIE family protein phosphatase [Rubinisphaera margarita]MCG6157415.1 SpoIIE family protein phosphatase [Rubinisphaera margarita]
MARLEVISGPHSGTTYSLRSNGVTAVGRDGTSDIVLPVRSISRHHAQIFCDGDHYFIEDLGSVNGTCVDGKRIKSRQQLHEGSRINFYEIHLVFHKNESSGEIPTFTPEPFDRAQEQAVNNHTVSVPAENNVWGTKRFQYLLDINSKLAGSLNLDEILPKVLDILFEIFPQSTNGRILLVEEDGELVPYACKAGRDDNSSILTQVPLGSELASTVLESGKDMLSNSDAFSESVLDEDVCSTMCVRLLNPDRAPLGVIEVETTDDQSMFHDDDLHVLRSVADMTGLAIAYARAHAQQMARARHQQQLEMAHEVQMRMLPRDRPEVTGYTFSDFYAAAGQVGGDFFYYRWLKANQLVVAIGDICGKGMPAALKMAHMNTHLHHVMGTARSLKVAMHRLNQGAFNDPTDISLITFVLCIFNVQKHELTIANAGHIPPLRRRAGSTAVEYMQHEKDGLPLGVEKDFEYHPMTYKFDPGDLVVLCTDGITEAMDGQSNLFGMDGLENSILKSRPNADQAVSTLVEDVRIHTRGKRQQDDMCIVSVSRDL